MFRRRKKNRSIWMALFAIPAVLSSSLIALVYSLTKRRPRGITPVTGRASIETAPPALPASIVQTAERHSGPAGWQVAPGSPQAQTPQEWRVAPEPEEQEDPAVHRMNTWGFVVLLVPFVLLLAAIIGNVVLRQAQTSPFVVPGGNPARGQALISQYGCASCHTIPGIAGANAGVGPPLTAFSKRSYIAGTLPNGPTDLTQWIMHPQQVKPGTAMPDMGVTFNDARDIAAYLYTLK